MRKIMPKRDTVMVHRIVDARWVAPPGVDAHRHLALIRHAERLFSFSDLLACTPPDEIDPGLAAGHVKPQEWWDDLASRRPHCRAMSSAGFRRARSVCDGRQRIGVGRIGLEKACPLPILGPGGL